MGKIKINLDVMYFTVFLVAVALLEAWKVGVPWYVGLAYGVVVAFVSSSLGIVPLVGQVVYVLVFRSLMIKFFGVWLSVTFWLGLVWNIVVSIVVGLILLTIFSRRW